MQIPGESWLARRAGWIVLGLCALAFGLRMNGLGFLLPQQVAIDETVLAREVERLESGRDDFPRDHLLGLYPDLLPRLAPHLSVHAGSSPESLPLSEHLARAAEPFFAVRLVVALLSILVVPGTYMLARAFLDARGALLAAALAATSFLDLWFAQQSRPHAAAGSLMLFAVLAALDLRRRPALHRYVLAGVAAGLAVGCLQYGIFVLPALLVAFVLRRRDGTAHPPSQDLAGLLLSLGIVAASFVAFYRFLWEADPGRDAGPFQIEGSTLHVYGHRVQIGSLGLQGLGTVLWTAWSYEPILSILALGAGAVALARPMLLRSLDAERRKELYVVLAFVLPFLAVLAAYGATKQRFLVPLVPFASVFAAWLLMRVFQWARGAFPVGALGAVLPVTLVLLPIGGQTIAVARLSWIRGSDDTLTQAATWIREHARAGEDRVLLSPALDLPLFRRAAILGTERGMTGRSFPWAVYQREHELAACLPQAIETVSVPIAKETDRESLLHDPASVVRSLGVRFAVIEVRDGWGWPGLQELRRGLQETGVLVGHFDPADAADPRPQPFAYEFERLPDRVAWMWRTFSTHRTGPVIEIYELR